MTNIDQSIKTNAIKVLGEKIIQNSIPNLTLNELSLLYGLPTKFLVSLSQNSATHHHINSSPFLPLTHNTENPLINNSHKCFLMSFHSIIIIYGNVLLI